MFKLGLEKAEETRDQIANIHWIIKKARELQKNFYFCFTDYAKAFNCVNHNKLREINGNICIPTFLHFVLRDSYLETTDSAAFGAGLVLLSY